MAGGRAPTICGIPSRCARSWTGIGGESIQIARCSSWDRIWGTRNLSSPTVHRGDPGSAATRLRTRLSAIRSFFAYVAVNEPQLLHQCQKVLAMPSKRYEKRTIDYLTHAEIEALVGAADLATRSWQARSDASLLALQTGLRVSELINLTCGDAALGTGAHVRCIGKDKRTIYYAKRLCSSAPRVA